VTAETPNNATAEAAQQLLESLARSDIRLTVEAGKLRVNAPKGALTDALKAAITAQRDALLGILGSLATTGIPRIPRGGALPVSSSQKRFWFLDQMQPGRPDYNTSVAIRIRGALDSTHLRHALDALVARHETLHMRLVGSAAGPVAELLVPTPANLQEHDVSALALEARESAMHRLLGETVIAGFDLAGGELCRFALIRMDAQDHVLILVVHHICADGWSLGLAVNEVLALYEQLAAGRDPVLPALPVQYPDYAAWEREQLESGRMARQLAYWKRQLEGAPVVLELPLDHPRAATQSFHGMHLRRQFDTALLANLKEVSRREGATLFMTLLAAWQVLLHRYTGQLDVVVGSPVANRNQPVLEGLIGCLVNNLVLRGDLNGNPTFCEYLARVKRMTVDAFESSDVPFDALVEAVNPPRTTSHAPLFQVLFSFLTAQQKPAVPAGMSVELLGGELAGVGTRASRFDLSLDLVEVEGRLSAIYEFATDLFEPATIERLHTHFETLLGAIVSDGSRRVGELPLVTEETLGLLKNWNDTRLEHDRSLCVHDLLASSARQHAGALAVTDGTTQLTYAQFDERVNRLANLLHARGVVRGALVGVCLDRSTALPVALAAVWKAGAAYVPLDPTHPADRLSYVLQDAGVACVITHSDFVARLGAARAPLLQLDALDSELRAQSAAAPAAGSQPDDLAYVIYTSGSTGRPKGVQVEHRNVVSFLEAMRREPGMGASDALLAVTTVSFDIAGLEMWLPLIVGARVVIASRSDLLDGQRLIDLIEEHGITVLQATPATWRLLIDVGWTGLPRLKALCGGEPLPRDLAGELVQRVGELWNMYGPTETTIWSTLGRVSEPLGPIAIGRPIANTRVYVLEPSGLPAPIGVAGELCVAGEGVARGYRNRPELTREKFVSLAVPGGGVERVYRTGDLARFRPDGQLEFIGRRDTQVKVRGYRIELGEIETLLAEQEGVGDCVVIVREDTPGDQRLVAYVVAEGGVENFDAEAARTSLRERLPDYMVPNQFATLDALPLTPNGKIDRKALPAPQTLGASRNSTADEVLMNASERRVAAIWREVLNITQVGLHDNFFDLGGHSLLLVKLRAVLGREFGREISLVELFQRTTVASQAERLSKDAVVSDAVGRAQARAARQIHG
jgi:amino acid adenylation domain-containing protein